MTCPGAALFRSLETAGEFYRAVLPPIGLRQVQQVIEPGFNGIDVPGGDAHEVVFL